MNLTQPFEWAFSSASYETKFWYASSSWVITRKMELKYTVTNKLSSVIGCRTGLPCKQWLPASICLLLFVSALYTGKRKQSWMLKVERWKRSLLRKPDGQTNIIFQKNFLFVYATNTMKSESRFRLLSFFLGKFFRLRKVFKENFSFSFFHRKGHVIFYQSS